MAEAVVEGRYWAMSSCLPGATSSVVLQVWGSSFDCHASWHFEDPDAPSGSYGHGITLTAAMCQAFADCPATLGVEAMVRTVYAASPSLLADALHEVCGVPA